MKMQLPIGTEIHYLCKPSYKVLLNENKYIDKIWVLQPNLMDTVKEINAQEFDCIIDLQNNLRTFVIKQFCKVKAYSFNKLNFSKFLLTQFKINRIPSIHIVDRYFEAVKELNVCDDGAGMDYFNPTLPADIYAKTGLNQEINFVAIAIGGQHSTKKMPFTQLSKLIEQIQHKIVLLGGKEDAELGKKLEELNPNKVTNFSGQLTLHESAGVVALSKAVITHDTGMMHIAAALKKPIITLWGNTIPEFGMGPYYGKHKIFYFNSEVPKLKCRPCHKLGHNQCPKGHFKCMNLQNIPTICLELEKAIG